MFFAIALAVSMTIATGFALAGAWPIMPFAGLEMLALGLALRMCARKARRYELIAIDEDRIEIRRAAGGRSARVVQLSTLLGAGQADAACEPQPCKPAVDTLSWT